MLYLNKTILVVTISMVLFAHAGIFGQTTELRNTVTQQVVPTSPEAASIMLYQTYPLDYVSGAPQISIPLFTVKAGNWDIPFTLDYQIGKVKPSIHSGIVGTGWTLSPDLGITKSIQGKEDKINQGYPINSQFGSTADAYLKAAALGRLDEQPDDYFYSLLGKSGSFVYKRSTGFVPLSFQPVRISHPDDNIFEITDDDGTIYLFGKYSTGSDIATEFSNKNNSDVDITTCWKITEIISYNRSDTIRFHYNLDRYNQILPYFNAQWQIIEYPHFTQTTQHYKEPEIYRASAHLQEPSVLEGRSGMEVLKPDVPRTGNFGEIIDFDLIFDEVIPQSDYKMTPSRLPVKQAGTNPKGIWNAIGDFGESYNDGSTVQLNYIKQIRLDSITFREGRVKLQYDNDNQLTSLVYYLAGRQVRHIGLKQHLAEGLSVTPEFMTSSLYNNYCKRFFLDSLTIRGSDSNAPGLSYAFSYVTDDLGVYSNYNTDYWDYRKGFKKSRVIPWVPYKVDSYIWYSGSPTNDSSDANIGVAHSTPVWMLLGDGQEESEQDYTFAFGLLSSITYPTGGKALFEFEQNQYESFATPNKIIFGGGARTKSIRYITAEGQDSLIKKYTYGTSYENGYGVTKNRQADYSFIYQQYRNTLGLNMTPPPDPGTPEDSIRITPILDTFTKVTFLNAKPFLNNAYSNGAAVLYPKVTEYQLSGKNLQPLGKTEYNYAINPNTVSPGIAMTPLVADARDSWRNIKPYSTIIYKYEDGDYIPVESKRFEYTDFITNRVPAAQTYLNWYSPEEDQILQYEAPYPVVEKFPHISYTILCGTSKLTKQTDTIFDDKYTSRKLVTTTTYRYDEQYLLPTGSTTTDSKGQQQVTHYWYPYQGTPPDFPSGQANLLSILTSTNKISYPVMQKDSTDGVLMHTARQEYQYLGPFALPGATYFSHRTADEYRQTEVLAYNGHGQVREQRDENGIITTFLWGYNDLYPVAKIIGSSYSSASALVSDAVLKNSRISDEALRTALNALRTGLPGAQIWTYTYLPGVGITSECSADGTLIYYSYDTLGRLTEVKDHEGNILETHRYHYLNQ